MRWLDFRGHRTPGREALVSELRLPVMSEARPFYFHPGGCQVIGDCLVMPIENGEGESFITFMDVSDPKDIREVSPAARIARTYNDAGSVGITNLTIAGKDSGNVMLYFHGGVYVIGAASHTVALVGEITRRTGVRALTLDYRLAPEHPYPAAVDDEELLDDVKIRIAFSEQRDRLPVERHAEAGHDARRRFFAVDDAVGRVH